MKTIEYNKLVRDLIPNVIEKAGKKPNLRTASEDEYFDKLKQKLLEEVNEFLESETVEELADIVEVVYAILETKEVSIDDFHSLREQKNKEKGAFKKKLILESVEE